MDDPAHHQSPSRLALAEGVTVSEGDLHVVFSRSGGPGGQSVNKVSTAAQLRVAVAALRGLTPGATLRLRRLAGRRLTREDEVLIRSDTHRSQARNRQACLDRLAELVAAAVPEPVPRRATRPTRGSVERRLAEKRRHGERKQRRGRPGEEEG